MFDVVHGLIKLLRLGIISVDYNNMIEMEYQQQHHQSVNSYSHKHEMNNQFV